MNFFSRVDREPPTQAIITSVSRGDAIATIFVSLGGWMHQPEAMRSGSWLSYAGHRVGMRGWLIRIGAVIVPVRMAQIVRETRQIERLEMMAETGPAGTAVFISHDLRGRRARRIERALGRLQTGEVHPSLERASQRQLRSQRV